MMRLEGIDLLRGIAVLAVVLYHFFELLGLQHSFLYPYFSSMGMLGVSLFFVISGYLIYRSIDYSISYKGIKKGLIQYSIRRLFRILPAYYFNFLIVLGLASTVVGTSYFYSSYFLNQIFTHLTFSSFFIYQTSGLGINGAYWTLSIEMLWYITVPLLFLFIHKDRYYLILFVTAFIYLWSIDLGIITEVFNLDTTASNYLATLYFFSFQLPAQIIYFIMGILVYKYLSKQHFSIPPFIQFILFITIIVLFIVLSHQSFFLHSFVIKNFITLVIVSFLFILFYKSNLRHFSLLNWIGEISYSIYLWHMPILFIMKQSSILSYLSILQTSLIFMILLIIISSMSYYFIEKGGIHLRKKLEKLL